MSACEPESIIKIINAVRKQESLWNVHCNDYGKRDKLEKAWNEVAQEVGKPDVFCRDKWRNVRTGFLRSIQHQIRDSTDDSNGLKRKRFYLHDQMAFLLPAAEALECTRKKRKLNKEHKSLVETDDTDGDSSNILAEYNLIRKIEPLENEENESEEFEHHTLMINGEVYTDNDDEEIFKILEHNKNTKSIENANSKDKHQQLSTKHKESNGIEVITNNNLSRSDTSMINEQNNIEFDSKLNNYKNVSAVKYYSPQFSQREEQQLVEFFRGCIDDILTLSKRKQRLFKKRMLDIIDELHDS
ncbi:uncharacterized protein LOC119604925 [Lucilia sericata]|uniref:uncharacterized protein LOC119604925 n=1 Tax=Lucilia sericata TaxID=13632 RepID=UPI0018A7F810|nr:uncharacterized protein LOC119604925 [Lucilia sericata]